MSSWNWTVSFVAAKTTILFVGFDADEYWIKTKVEKLVEFFYDREVVEAFIY